MKSNSLSIYYLLLGFAVLNVSTASILVRLAYGEGVHGFAAASWRLLLSSLMTGSLLIIYYNNYKRELGKLNLRDLLLMAVSGVSLALHFDLWMLSLAYVAVAVSVTIVDSYPALLALAGRVIYGERYAGIQYLGSLLAMIGIALLSFSSVGGGAGSNPLLGSLLAFGGMVGVAVYFIVGKGMRSRYSTIVYTTIVYGIAGVSSVILSIILGVKLLGFTGNAWLYLILLALVPMLGGHSVLNYVIKRLSLLATTVPVLGEPVGATILAFIILDENVGVKTIILMGLTLTGIGLVLLGEASRRAGG